jgi:hypothetical protein
MRRLDQWAKAVNCRVDLGCQAQGCGTSAGHNNLIMLAIGLL